MVGGSNIRSTIRLLADHALLALPAGFRRQPDAATRYGVVDRHREDQGPALARLNALVEANLRAAGIDVPRVR